MIKFFILVGCFLALKAFAQTDLKDQDLIEMDSLTSETQQADTQSDDVSLKDLEEPAETTPVPSTDRTDQPARTEEVLSKKEEAEKAEKDLYTQPNPSFSTPVITSEEVLEDDKVYNPKKNHWVTSYGFDYIKYEVPWVFEGTKKNFREKKQELFGLNIGAGREFHLGGGTLTATKFNAFFRGATINNVKTADPNIEDQEFAQGKRIGQMLGGEISQSLSFQFDYKAKNPIMGDMFYLTFEPFVEAAIGYAEAFNKMNYGYDTSDGSGGTSGINEAYRHSIKDIMTTRRVSAGFNITSSQSYYFFTKFSLYQLDNLSRRQKGFERQDDQAQQDLVFNDEKPGVQTTTAFTIGGGYKF